uniref:Uncharacterized protein n=1 Tax=Arundo donax TaxID=35708 RepID=A0A0A9HET4_ARUDO
MCNTFYQACQHNVNWQFFV